jgi:hypothetical protein
MLSCKNHLEPQHQSTLTSHHESKVIQRALADDTFVDQDILGQPRCPVSAGSTQQALQFIGSLPGHLQCR